MITGYKIIAPNWKAKRRKYAVGETVTMPGAPELGKRGFHFCLDIDDCRRYYRVTPRMHVCVVEALGDVDGPTPDGDSACCTNRLRIVREVPYRELPGSMKENAGK